MEDNLEAIFQGIATAKPMGGFKPNIKTGRYDQLMFTRFEFVPSKKAGGPGRLEAEFVVLDGPAEEIGATRSVPWFIEGKGFGPQYAQDRANIFLATVRDSMDPALVKALVDTTKPIANPNMTEDQKQIQRLGVAIARKSQPAKGLVLACEATAGDKVNDKGEPYMNYAWSAVGVQSAADIAANLGAVGGSVEAEEPAPAPAPAPAPTPVATVKAPGVKLNIGGKK